MDSKVMIDRIFENLDCWRQLPAYQLERRADVFFSLYLDEIVKAKLGRKPKHIIPEFPIRKSGSNLSNKMDYLAVMEDPPLLVFIELKTDPASMGLHQLAYLMKARDAQDSSNSELFEGLGSIAPASKAEEKYERLRHELIRAGLIDGRANAGFELAEHFPDPLRAVILYIHPCPKRPAFLKDKDPLKIMDISFVEVEEIVRRNEDDLSIRFAESLKSWTNRSDDQGYCTKNGKRNR